MNPFQGIFVADNAHCPRNADIVFGPVVDQWCRTLDFTLTFEQTILSLIPDGLFILSALICLYRLQHAPKSFLVPNWIGFTKALTAGFLASLKLVLLVLSVSSPQRTPTSVPSAVVCFVASTALVYLAWILHFRLVRPSTLLCLYLLVSSICDAFQVRTLHLINKSGLIAFCALAALCVKALLLFLECQSKESLLRDQYRDALGADDVAGVFDKWFLTWLNPLFISGYRKLLTNEDLPRTDVELSSEYLRDLMQEKFDKRSRPEGRFTLIWTIFRCMLAPFLGSLLPRTLYGIVRYAQPLLISRAIVYVSDEQIEAADSSTGYDIIAAAAFIYATMAVTKSRFGQRRKRLNIMIRGALVGIIHNKALTMQDGVFDDSAAVTLMSSDVDSSIGIFDMASTLWASILEVIIGFYLLSRRLGWACVVPAVLVVVNSRISVKITSNIVPKLKIYKMSRQKRVSITGSWLGSMKSIKMMGLADTMTSVITKAREQELEDFKVYRWLVVGYNAAANSLTFFAPSITLVIFAIQAKIRGLDSFDTELAFSVIAVITLVVAPAEQLMMIVPGFAGAMASCGRIQDYLLKPSKDDQRLDIPQRAKNAAASDDSIEITDGDAHETSNEPSVVFENVTLRPAANAEPALMNINLRLNAGTLNVIAGIVGSGKTTLVRAMLGDLPPDSGTISVRSRHMAYCTQTAWLSNESIKDIICGPSGKTEVDEAWYKRAVTACGLDEDIQNLPDRDQTVIGSRGVQLSGGQRQRVALSRAVYARMDVVLLDDVLSALDAGTERLVAERLLGPKGIFRDLETTVVLITHSTRYLPLADQIVVLSDNGEIAEQGTWAELRSSGQYIRDVILKDHSEESDNKSDNNPSALSAKEKAKAIPTPSDDAVKDLTRQSGDVAIYGYYFRNIGRDLLASVLVIFAAYSFFLTFPRYWLKWWTEAGGQHMTLYVLGYLGLSFGAILCNISYIVTFLQVVAPRSGLKLHGIVLKIVSRAPLSFFATTDIGVTLNRFSQDMQIVDQRLPISLLTFTNQSFKLIAECILLFSSETYMGSTLPLCALLLYMLQKIYLRTSRQLRFMGLEAKAPVYSDFLETLEGLPTIRAFGWERHAIVTNIKRLDMSQRPEYTLLCVQQWLSLVLDLFIAALAVLLVSLAVTLKGTSSGGQMGIALNVILSLHSVLLRMLEQFTVLETSLGAIARIKTFEETTKCEDKPTENVVPAADWPERGSVEFKDVSASYNAETQALQSLSLKVEAGQKVGICGRTGSGKSSMLLTILRLLDLDSGTIFIDDVDISTLPRETVRTRLIAIPQDSFVLSDTVRFNVDPSGTVPETVIVEALKKVQLWAVFEARSRSKNAQDNDASKATNGKVSAADGNGTATASTSGSPAPQADVATKSKVKNDVVASSNPLDELLKSSPLSQGQQQLFNLSRAIIRKYLNPSAKILVLDEATSNVDPETDKLMQKIIREEFKNHTIITIAHRLDTIMDSDRVAVLGGGRVLEFDTPDNLLHKEGGSAFKDLYAH